MAHRKSSGRSPTRIIPETNEIPTPFESPLDAARLYLKQGFQPIRLQAGAKRPRGKHQQNLISPANIEQLITSRNHNIGLMLGTEHGGLADIDLDWADGSRLADLVFEGLPHFGRCGINFSSWLAIY